MLAARVVRLWLALAVLALGSLPAGAEAPAQAAQSESLPPSAASSSPDALDPSRGLDDVPQAEAQAPDADAQAGNSDDQTVGAETDPPIAEGEALPDGEATPVPPADAAGPLAESEARLARANAAVADMMRRDYPRGAERQAILDERAAARSAYEAALAAAD